MDHLTERDLRIGDGSTIAANAVVLSDVPPNSLAELTVERMHISPTESGGSFGCFDVWPGEVEGRLLENLKIEFNR
jgi:hypothetical protein